EGVSDEEVGGSRGREAVARLRNVFQRIASQWRPANAEESYEIVRRRLFDSITEKEAFTKRDLVLRAFTDRYAKHAGELPSECRESWMRRSQTSEESLRHDASRGHCSLAQHQWLTRRTAASKIAGSS